MTDSREPSRRDFLASALVFAGLALREELPLDEELLYVGTYTDADRPDGIYLLRMDLHSGALRLVGSVKVGPNPSFLAIHPNAQVLYAVNEVETGAVSAFAIAGDTGALTRLGEAPSEGNAPCFVSVDKSGRVVLVANYEAGTVALLPIETNGALARATSVDQHTGHGPNADRQSAPHAHCIIADPSTALRSRQTSVPTRLRVPARFGGVKSLQRIDGGGRCGAGAGRDISFRPRCHSCS
jgi:6-phosphogluconolactonase